MNPWLTALCSAVAIQCGLYLLDQLMTKVLAWSVWKQMSPEQRRAGRAPFDMVMQAQWQSRLGHIAFAVYAADHWYKIAQYILFVLIRRKDRA